LGFRGDLGGGRGVGRGGVGDEGGKVQTGGVYKVRKVTVWRESMEVRI
jgi:hypothetical protein